MRPFRQLSSHPRVRKPLLAGVIAVIASGIAVMLGRSSFVRALNEPIYDHAYELRPPGVPGDSPIVIVTADDQTLRALGSGWPCARTLWGFGADFVQKCGARAVAIDMLFTEPSLYNSQVEDDKDFAQKIDEMKIPVVLAADVREDGTRSPFAPPVHKPVFGVVNISDATARDYPGDIRGMPSLAVQVVRALGRPVPDWANRPFRLQYYGHHEDAHGRTTFPYISASRIFPSSTGAPSDPPDPAIFKDKIVLFGATGAGTYDLKSSPLDRIYPGVEIHATAIADILNAQHVVVASNEISLLVTVLVATAAAVGATAPRRTWLKLLLSAVVIAVLVACVSFLFTRRTIVWLPPVAPLTGIFLSVVLSLSWSYFAEDRQARFFLKALGQYVSPQIAAELKSNPAKLAISTEKGDLTILFSDIVSFTTLSEQLDERIGPLLNFYLDEMSAPILAEHGTVDKYIGDAIMSFWNAPVRQEDHAIRACRAALAMQRRLLELQPEFARLGADMLSARIGINTGLCTYGNMGSRAKFNYSIIGDPCNFASRLEGANKIYHTDILIGEATRNLVWDRFVLRKVDVLRVKGKQKPLAIYELMGEGLPDPATADLINKYESAYQHYCRSEWDEADRLLCEILAVFPRDGPSRELLSRVTDFRQGPKLQYWDGVFVAKEK